MRIAVFGNTFQSDKAQFVKSVFDVMISSGVSIDVDGVFMRYLNRELGLRYSGLNPIDGDDFAADIVVSLGGDGTFLETARRVGSKQLPVLGVNTGRMGFLADADGENFIKTFESLISKTYFVEQRSLLQVKTEGDLLQGSPFALNEVAVLKRDNSSMISIGVDVNGHFLNNYHADGLLVSTPTGSTGYSLSAGGPILAPGCGSVCITPVAPHSLSVRPLIISDNVEIKLQILSRTNHYLISLDGRSEVMNEATHVTISRAPYEVSIVRLPGHTFFGTMRDKLSWGADARL